jgi:predicted dehydrogenase
MRIGLLGCGTVVRYCHLPALRRIRSVSVVAAADASEESLRLARANGGIETFSRCEDVLARADVDAVVIALPSHLHADLACAALQAGKQVYLEKPVATTSVDTDRLLDVAASTGVRAVVGFNRRLHPMYRQARSILHSGQLGAVRAVHASFCEPTPASGLPSWKQSRATGGGVLLDLFSHHADLLRWFLNDEMMDVRAATSSKAGDGDAARVELTTHGGVAVQGFYSFHAGYADHLEFMCEGGSLRVDRHAARLVVRVPRRGYGLREVFVPPTPEIAAWWSRRLIRRSEDPSYFHALRAFAEPQHESSGELATMVDGVKSLRTVLAAEEAAQTNRVVMLRGE